MSDTRKIAIVAVAILVVVSGYFVVFPQPCYEADPNGWHSFCTCLGYERVVTGDMIGGGDSVCHGIVLSQEQLI